MSVEMHWIACLTLINCGLWLVQQVNFVENVYNNFALNSWEMLSILFSFFMQTELRINYSYITSFSRSIVARPPAGAALQAENRARRETAQPRHCPTVTDPARCLQHLWLITSHVFERRGAHASRSISPLQRRQWLILLDDERRAREELDFRRDLEILGAFRALNTPVAALRGDCGAHAFVLRDFELEFRDWCGAVHIGDF